MMRLRVEHNRSKSRLMPNRSATTLATLLPRLNSAQITKKNSRSCHFVILAHAVSDTTRSGERRPPPSHSGHDISSRRGYSVRVADVLTCSDCVSTSNLRCFFSKTVFREVCSSRWTLRSLSSPCSRATFRFCCATSCRCSSTSSCADSTCGSAPHGAGHQRLYRRGTAPVSRGGRQTRQRGRHFPFEGI